MKTLCIVLSLACFALAASAADLVLILPQAEFTGLSTNDQASLRAQLDSCVKGNGDKQTLVYYTNTTGAVYAFGCWGEWQVAFTRAQTDAVRTVLTNACSDAELIWTETPVAELIKRGLHGKAEP